MAYKLAYSYWIAKIMQDKSAADAFVPKNLENETIPDSISETKEEKYVSIRQKGMPEKLLIPLYLLFSKLFGIKVKNYNSLEVQESVLYDMIILSTVLLIAYIVTRGFLQEP